MLKKEKGFTLVELLIIITLLLSIISIAIVSIDRVNSNLKKRAALISFKTIINSIKNEDLLNHVNGNFIKVFSVKDKTNNNILRPLIEKTDSLEDGLISMYGSYLVQANLCINGYSIKYYFEDGNGNYNAEKSDKYCHYSDENGIINLDNIDENNKIVGLSYKNNKYYDFNSERYSKFGMSMPKILNDTYITKIKLENMSISKNDNNKSSIETISYIDNFPSKFDLRDKNGVTSPKSQDGGLCWAYASIGSVESNLLYKKGINKDFSEKLLDYIGSNNGILFENKLINNPYDQQHPLDGGFGGGTYSYAFDLFFTGLSLKDEKNFKFHKTLDKPKPIEEVINNSDIEYYPTDVEYYNIHEYDAEELEIIKKDVKSHINNYGGLAVTVKFGDNELNVYENFDKKNNVLINNTGVGLHAVLIIGWDDDYTYNDIDGNTKKGVWIAKNSYAAAPFKYGKYFYIGYDTDILFHGISVHEVSERDWDKSYDSYNNAIQNDNNFYFEIPDNSSEQIIGLGYYNISTSFNDMPIYVLDVDNYSDCSGNYNAYDDIVDNYDGTFTYMGEKISGFSYKPELDYLGFKIFKINNDYKFKNNVCVITPYYSKISLFTKLSDSSKKVTAEKISDTKIKVVTSNITSGSKIEYEVYDEKNQNVTNMGKVNITDNYLINNTAKLNLEVVDNRKYTIKIKVDNVYANKSIIINDDKQLENLCSASISENNAWLGDEFSVNVTCLKTNSDIYHFDDINKYLSYSRKKLNLIGSNYEETENKVIYKYFFKAISAGHATIIVTKNLQLTNDVNYNVNMQKFNIEIYDDKPVCTITYTGKTDKYLYTDEKLKIEFECNSERKISEFDGKELDDMDFSNHIINDVNKIFEFSNPNILLVESAYYKYDRDARRINIFISVTRSEKSGKTTVALRENVIKTELGVGNDYSKSDFEINAVDLKSLSENDKKIKCTFDDGGIIIGYNIKRKTSKDIIFTCSSKLPFSNNINPIVVPAKILGIKHVSTSNVTKYDDDYSDRDFIIRYTVNVTGKHIGFTHIELKEGTIVNIEGIKNSKTKSNTIWVTLFLE